MFCSLSALLINGMDGLNKPTLRPSNYHMIGGFNMPRREEQQQLPEVRENM